MSRHYFTVYVKRDGDWVPIRDANDVDMRFEARDDAEDYAARFRRRHPGIETDVIEGATIWRSAEEFLFGEQSPRRRWWSRWW